MIKEKKRSLLKVIAGLFYRNWGLKLLALALSILIYQTLKPTSELNSSNKNDRIILSH